MTTHKEGERLNGRVLAEFLRGLMGEDEALKVLEGLAGMTAERGYRLGEILRRNATLKEKT